MYRKKSDEIVHRVLPINYIFGFLKQEKSAKIISYCLIGLMIMAVVVNSLYKADWILGDDFECFTNTAIGKYKSIWDDIRTDGRFFPLGHFDLNLTLFIPHGHTPAVHYSLGAFEFMLSIVVLFLLFKNCNADKTKAIDLYIHTLYILLLILFIAPLSHVFMEVIFPEKILFLSLPLFMLFYLKGWKTQKIKYYILALLFAVYSTYCKEPVFGVFIVIVLTHILFEYKRITKIDWIFYVSLLVNGLIYIVLYYFIVYKKVSSFYNGGQSASDFLPFIAGIFKNGKILILTFILAIIRGFYVVVKKDKEHLFYDGLLFAGIAYTVAFIMLRMSSDTYFIPSVVLALPSIVYWTHCLYKKKRTGALFIIASIILISLCNISSVREKRGNVMRARENSMPSIEKINENYKKNGMLYWYETNNYKSNMHIIMIWQKNVISAFLNYVNKRSINQDIFMTINYIPSLKNNDIFFYSKQNGLPVPDDITNKLMKHHFTLEEEIFEGGIQVYRYQSGLTPAIR